jgi:uncharacterized protein
VVRALVAAAVTGVAAAGMLRWSKWAISVTAVGLGIVGTAVGAGIGVPHAVKGSPVVLSVAALVCLATGLILLVGGAVSLVRSTHGWRRVGVGLAALLLAVPLVWSLAMAMAATNVPTTSLGPQTPADRGLSYRDVRFPATDGVSLSGWYVPGINGAAVVLLHGAGSTRTDVLDHAAVLADHGFGVLLFDARGHGRSAGRAMDFGWFGDEDVGGAVSFLAVQPGVAKIATVGLSMGGEEAIGAAAADGRIGAVVAEGATNRVAGDKAWLPDVYGLRGWLQRPVDWLTYGTTDLLTDAGPPITLRTAAARTTSPILLITAGDVAEEAHAARYIAAGSPSTVARWDVPDTGHTQALDTHPNEWERRVVAFLDDALGVR